MSARPVANDKARRVAAPTGLELPLRPYQVEAGKAIVESVVYGRGLSFSVEIARQGGKNELSSRIELLLLCRNLDRDVTSIKAAPTLKPQALISLERLWQRAQDAKLGPLARREGGNAIRVGRARQLFLSAEPGSNIVGHTADLLLEVDEAQDVALDKYDKELRPMAASRGATTVFYGTAWDSSNLLERARLEHIEAEARDGIRRHFEYDWHEVALHNPAYARFVEAEERRLGADHPLFLTQFCLKPLPDQGRLLNSVQRGLMHGSHGPQEAAVPGEVYVAGLDVGGEQAESGSGRHDATVLTVARLVLADAGDVLAEPSLEVVAHYAWEGAPHTELYGALLSLLRDTWRVQRVAVDATGLGEALASFLGRRLAGRVDRIKFTAESKSDLGYELLRAAGGGRLRLYRDGSSPLLAECWRQIELCRASYRPNRQLAFAVDVRDGHDDYVMSLALAVKAGSQPARQARGRASEYFVNSAS